MHQLFLCSPEALHRRLGLPCASPLVAVQNRLLLPQKNLWAREHLIPQMAVQSWVQTLITAQTAGATLTGGTATSLLPSAARFVLPANYFNPGSMILLRATGVMSTAVGSAGNFTLTVNMGSIASAITAFTSGSMNLAVAGGTASLLNQTWDMNVLLTCRSIGTTTATTLIGTGDFNTRCLLGAAASGTSGGVGGAIMPDTAPAVGTGFDSTTTNTVDLFGQFSVSNVNNSITLYQYMLASLN